MKAELRTITDTIQTTELDDGTRVTILTDLANGQKEVRARPDGSVEITVLSGGGGLPWDRVPLLEVLGYHLPAEAVEACDVGWSHPLGPEQGHGGDAAGVAGAVELPGGDRDAFPHLRNRLSLDVGDGGFTGLDVLGDVPRPQGVPLQGGNQDGGLLGDDTVESDHVVTESWHPLTVHQSAVRQEG